MKKIIDLTPDDQLRLDPTGKARQWIRGLFAHNESKPNPSNPYFRITPEEMLERYSKLLSKLPLEPLYKEFNESMFKHWAPQGGHIARDIITGIFSEYYDDANMSTTFIHPIIYRGRDYLLRLIKSKMDSLGGPQYVTEMGVTGTAGGLPTMQPKGCFDAETVGAGHIIHLFPALPGTRNMRGKSRGIFMDATVNVRMAENILSSVKRWLVSNFPELFSSWMNPYKARNLLITRGLRKGLASVETDYKGMDMRFRKQIALEIIYPIYELLLPDYALTLGAYIEEEFEKPLYMGDVLWTGEHTLFSGAIITNDFETLYTICLALGVLLTLGILNDAIILALGDDCSVLVPKNKAELMIQMMIDVSSESGLIIHPIGAKSQVRYGSLTFCREIFTPKNSTNEFGVMQGRYPSVLALNSVVQPEKFSRQGVGGEVAAMLQRLDGIRYNQEFAPVLDLVQRFLKPDVDLTNPKEEIPQDWWERVYGERWTPQCSASWRYYAHKKNNTLVFPAFPTVEPII
jgi:hypothetical protein